jgi:hypothetical protein
MADGALKRGGEIAVAVAAAGAAAQVFRKGFTARLLSNVSRTALRRGMHSGSKAWIYAGAAASGLRLLHSVAGRKEEVTRIKLRKGERLEIRETTRRK